MKDILDFISIENLLSRLGIDYTSRGNGQYMAICPYHREKTASFSINSQGLFHCFGCGAKGNAYTLIKDLTGENPYKFLNIENDYKYSKESNISMFSLLQKGNARKKNKIEEKKQENISFSIIAQSHHPFDIEISKQYCLKRNIDEEDIKRYNIQYYSKAYINNTDFFERLVIPVHNRDGNIIAYEGRDVTYSKAKKCIYPYQSKIGNTIFNNHKLDRTKPVIFVEGIMDLITVAKYLPDIQVSTYFGIQLSHAQIDLVNEFSDVYLMLDSDDGGSRGVDNFLDIYEGEFKICLLNNGKDPNESSEIEIRKAFNTAITKTEYLLKREGLLQKKVIEW